MTMRVNAAQGVGFDAKIDVAAMPEQGINIDFHQFGPSEDYSTAKLTKENAVKTINAQKNNMELKIPFIGTDYIKFAGNGKMTYGELREILGIPPKVLSETNNKKLSDDQIVKDVRINLEDIGWYAMTPQSPEEAADYRNQRNYGNHYAGYDRALTNEDIKKLFGK